MLAKLNLYSNQSPIKFRCDYFLNNKPINCILLWIEEVGALIAYINEYGEYKN